MHLLVENTRRCCAAVARGEVNLAIVGGDIPRELEHLIQVCRQLLGHSQPASVAVALMLYRRRCGCGVRLSRTPKLIAMLQRVYLGDLLARPLLRMISCRASSAGAHAEEVPHHSIRTL